MSVMLASGFGPDAPPAGALALNFGPCWTIFDIKHDKLREVFYYGIAGALK
jgi:hypothetical protein